MVRVCNPLFKFGTPSCLEIVKLDTSNLIHYPYREVCRAKGGIGSGETLCHDIYPARPITTVSLATNTYCMMYGHSSCTPRIVGRRVQFSGVCVNRAINDRPGIQQEAICYQWFKQ